MSQRKPDISPPSPFMSKLGERLKHLRENVRHLSPEELETRVAAGGGKVSASYIRRIEKGINTPTIEMLSDILKAMDSNLGLFFEYMIQESNDRDKQDQRHHRILQRSLEAHRDDTIAVINILERQL